MNLNFGSPPKPGERRGGRKKGSKNKLNDRVAKIIEYALKEVGGKEAFARWAKSHKDLFFIHFIKPFIPRQMNLADADGQKLEPVRIVRIVAPVVLTPPAPPAVANGHHS